MIISLQISCNCAKISLLQKFRPWQSPPFNPSEILRNYDPTRPCYLHASNLKIQFIQSQSSRSDISMLPAKTVYIFRDDVWKFPGAYFEKKDKLLHYEVTSSKGFACMNWILPYKLVSGFPYPPFFHILA